MYSGGGKKRVHDFYLQKSTLIIASKVHVVRTNYGWITCMLRMQVICHSCFLATPPSTWIFLFPLSSHTSSTLYLDIAAAASQAVVWLCAAVQDYWTVETNKAYALIYLFIYFKRSILYHLHVGPVEASDLFSAKLSWLCCFSCAMLCLHVVFLFY